MHPWLRTLTSCFSKKRSFKGSFSPYFDLQELLNELNQAYFGNACDIPIGWYGTGTTKARKSIRLAYYHQNKQIIRINRILNDEKIPKYFLSYVIYHEMLHHVYPPIIPLHGSRKIHHPKFLAKEKEYHDYVRAKEFLKAYIQSLFSIR